MESPVSESAVSHDPVEGPPVDSFLLLSFGGPQGPDEVMPFLRNVTAGRGVPDERLAAVAEHYYHFGGVSPITAQNQALLAALGAEFGRRGIDLPLYFGNRNWHPFLTDTARQLAADGRRHALVLATSATGSYSGCRQYREDLARALDRSSDRRPALRFTKLRHYFDHPGFVAANADGGARRAGRAAGRAARQARLVFTAHSDPGVDERHRRPGRRAVPRPAPRDRPAGGRGGARRRAPSSTWCGSPGPGRRRCRGWSRTSTTTCGRWRRRACAAVLVAPTGFVSDHLEVLWDLDNEARETAAELGPAVRPGRHRRHRPGSSWPAWWTWWRSSSPAGRAAHLGRLGVCGQHCPAGCCPAPARRSAAADRGRLRVLGRGVVAGQQRPADRQPQRGQRLVALGDRAGR